MNTLVSDYNNVLIEPQGLGIEMSLSKLVMTKQDSYLSQMAEIVGTEREKQKTAHFILNDYVKKGNERSKNRVFIVHRLDRDTSGILIFAKNENTKYYLQDHWKEFSKTYFTVVHGKLKDKEGVITSYLMENRAFRVFSVNDPDKGKFSKTGYKVIGESGKYSLLEINLITGIH